MWSSFLPSLWEKNSPCMTFDEQSTFPLINNPLQITIEEPLTINLIHQLCLWGGLVGVYAGRGGRESLKRWGGTEAAKTTKAKKASKSLSNTFASIVL